MPLSSDVDDLLDRGLSRDELLLAVDALCGANRPSALVLGQIAKRMVESRSTWAAQARRMDRIGLSAQHLIAPLPELLDLPGDVGFLQAAEGRFHLVHRRDQRWFLIGVDGEPLADLTEEGGTHFIEAVLTRMPLAEIDRDGGLASLMSLWPALRSAWAEIGVASLFVNAGQLLLPLFSMLVYDKVVSNGVFETLWALSLGMVIYLMTDAGMRVVRCWSVERIGEALTRRGDEMLWTRLASQVDSPTGGFARFLSNYRDLSLSRDFVSSMYLMAVADLPFMVLYLIVIGIVAWPLLIVALILVGLYTTAGLVIQKRANDIGKDAELENTRKLSYLGDLLSVLDIVRTVPGSGFFVRRWRDFSERAARVDARRRSATNHLNTLSAAMQTGATVCMLITGAYLIDGRILSVGGLIAANLLLGRAMGLVASLFMVTGKWKEFRRAAARMETSLSVTPSKGYTSRPSITGHIAVTGLVKRYEGRPPALEGVSFKIRPGERIALLGRPGAGKSTLLRAVAGLVQPDAGHILIDGLSLTNIDRHDRARWMAWKAQEPALFAGSLEDNLRVSGVAAADERFQRAVWASGLEIEFESGRMSLGMQLEERGGNLSGGQRQKVALARALAQPSKILLLDEPTLGLDPEGESSFAERLPACLAPEGILLMTTHSSTMLRTVNRVIVLDAGRVFADGPREKVVTLSS